MDDSSKSFWYEIAHNRVLVASTVAWAIAQTIKVLIGVTEERRFNFKWFIESGGMPSAHTAFVVSAATSVGIYEGFHSAIFASVTVFALIIMFDAQGVRRHSGKQAETLNKILDDIYAHRNIELEPLKELFGHTPVEVIAGAVLGILAAMAFA